MVEHVIDAWCCKCRVLVIRETVMSEITALGWSECDDGLLCPNCTYYLNRAEGGPILLPPPDYSVMRPRFWDGKPGHWEGRMKEGEVHYVWISNAASKPKLFGPTMCALLGHKVRSGMCPRCRVKVTLQVEDTTPPPCSVSSAPLSRYEKARQDKNSTPLFLSADKCHIFGPDGLHLVKGLRSNWQSIADDEDVAEDRARFLAMDLPPLTNIASDPRIKAHLAEVSTRLMADDLHLPGGKE
jgi:hypothetical protein